LNDTSRETDNKAADTAEEPNTEEGTEKDPVQELQEKCAALQDQYMRTLAEMENLKKRHAREKTESLSYGASKLLRDILPVVDNFERAMMMAKDQKGPLAEGMMLIQKELQRFLEAQGVTVVEAMDKAFDPHVHEAMQEEASRDVPAGQVLRVMQTGYQLRERLLRPAMVVVAKNAAEEVSEDPEEASDDSAEEMTKA